MVEALRLVGNGWLPVMRTAVYSTKRGARGAYYPAGRVL